MIYLKNVKEIIKPNSVFVEHIEKEIKETDELTWLIKVLENKEIEHFYNKEWFYEAGFLLHKIDDICLSYELPTPDSSLYNKLRTLWNIINEPEICEFVNSEKTNEVIKEMGHYIVKKYRTAWIELAKGSEEKEE